jgi:hypothetical protein
MRLAINGQEAAPPISEMNSRRCICFFRAMLGLDFDDQNTKAIKQNGEQCDKVRCTNLAPRMLQMGQP